ncbi:AAA family ATPase [Rhodococcus sp. 5G237]
MTTAGLTPEHIRDLPNWLREVDVALAANPQIAITGNLRDYVVLPRPGVPHPRFATVLDAVGTLLSIAGHTAQIVFDIVGGPRVLGTDPSGVAAAVLAQARSTAGSNDSDLALLQRLLESVTQSEQAVCLVVENASRLTPGPDFTDPDFHRVLVTAEKLVTTARRNAVAGPHLTPLYNPVFWLIDQENDLPHWLVSTDAVRVISIPAPTFGNRRTVAASLVSSLPGASEMDAATRESVVERYAAHTNGLTLRSLMEINRLAIDRRIPATSIEDAVRTFRVGVPDNPWQDPALKQRIRDGARYLGERVLGQGPAVRKSVDILIRSTTGLTGAQGSGDSSRPQGILFFAGPTGVGKTELAKSMAELVFGRKDAFVRFDMSEFSSEHAEARLIGAPPGYVGHNSGGELTNAVRHNPFSLLLFDEIEKAHPRILDKFLQILEDGRLTDGNGSTVYFSETLIVFTSNLGVYRTDEYGERVPVVARGRPYTEVDSTIRAAVSEHFTKEIGRPELLNRIGDNIVVFDFISPETAEALVPLFVRNVVERVHSITGVQVTVSDVVIKQLIAAACERLDFGGRGVGTVVETMLINPLSRALFERDDEPGCVTVASLDEQSTGWVVSLS